MKPLTTTFASSVFGAGGYALATYGLGPVGFAAAGAPAILGAAGAAMPVVWNMFSALPPKPVKEYFPGITLLFNIESDQPKPVTMPPWQKMLRVGALAAAALGAAAPEYQSALVADASSPVVLFVDNGWASAPDWDHRAAEMEMLVRAAGQKDRPVVIVPAAQKPENETPFYTLQSADFAQTLLPTITAQSWPVDYTVHIAPLQALRAELGAQGPASVYWLSDGLMPNSPDFVDALQALGDVQIIQGEISSGPHLLSLDKTVGDTMTVTVERPLAGAAYTLDLLALNENGQPVLQNSATFAEGDTTAKVEFAVPPDIRANLARVVVRHEKTAGATLLLDAQWRKRTVGVVDTGLNEALLDGSNFVRQAIRHSTDLRSGSIADILTQDVSVMTWTDEAVLPESDRQLLHAWVKGGGTLIRFAGPNLAAQPADDLVPVPLMQGARAARTVFGGASTGALAPFPAHSPLYGIDLPAGFKADYFVLSEPHPDLAARTWAQLDDGTPFITARSEGEGRIILVHSTANTQWSNLPLTGEFFLKMMNALVTSAQSKDGASLKADMPPLLTLNAAGELQKAPRDVKPLSAAVFDAHKMSAVNPPGYYGNYAARMAYNVADSVDEYVALDGRVAADVPRASYQGAQDGADYRSWLYMAAFLAMMADLGVSYRRAGNRGGFFAKNNDGRGGAGDAPTPD